MLAGMDRGKLQGMRQAAQSTVPASSGSFAGILAALSGPGQKSDPRWNDDGLEADVATLSYEHALRAHARYLQADAEAAELKKAVDPGPIRIREAFPAKASSAGQTGGQRAERPRAALGDNAGMEPGSAHGSHELPGRDTKRASITLRLSETECAQLRRRANDAGLTVSGYLRSCTLEAEVLRAQVKEALAKLRAVGAKASESGSTPVRHGWFRWLLKHGNRNQARAA
jgi:hypothetical protein